MFTPFVLGAASEPWKMIGIGDFNCDGVSDVLWAHDAGSIGAWITDNERIAVGSWMPVA